VAKYIEMKLANKFFFVFILVLFGLGAAVCLNPNITKENMENMLSDEVPLERVQTENNSCPDLLIRSANRLYLHNTNMPKSDSNPIVFENLDSYLEYLKTQRAQNIRCPVLFLPEENNAQGQDVYRMRPSPVEMEGGSQTAPIRIVDGSRDNPPYNQNQYAGFDPVGFNVGQYTELDRIHNSTANAKISDNPMDPNWGGTLFSREAVESGKYAENEVGKPTMVPKVVEIYK
jgi:hypothetical protein